MKKLERFWDKWRQMSGIGKAAFFKSLGLLLLTNAGLTFLPFNRFRKVFSKLTHSSCNRQLTDQQVAEIVWAVNVAANNLPVQSLCLPRALVTKYLLKDVESVVLRIGVDTQNVRDSFKAHAWVEKGGRIIIGDWPEATFYHTLWAWE